MAVSIRPYIIINGKSSNEVTGLMISTLPPITKPMMRVSAEEIDGRDGDIVTELGFSAYDKEIEIGLTGNYDVNEVISFFNQSGQVIFSNEPDKYYRFAIYNAIDFEKLIRYKTATVTFHVQPFKFSTEENDAVFYSPESVSITNEGNINSRPEMAIQGSGQIGIAVNGSDVLSIDLGETEQSIIIDSEGMNAYGTSSNIKNLVVDVNAVQSGEGTASPNNVRPITGWDECNLTHTGGNEPVIYTEDFGQTVYGGTINFTTGVMTIDNGFITYDGSENWSYSNNGYTVTKPTGAGQTSETDTGLCNMAERTDSTNVPNGTYRIGAANVIVRLGTGNNDVPTFKAFLANNNMQLVYPLATPIEVQLTAEEIESFIGINTFQADTGAISELVYTKEGEDISVSGNVVSFEIDAKDLNNTILKNRLVTGNYDNLRLKAGTNQIGVTGDVSVMVLSNFSRWL